MDTINWSHGFVFAIIGGIISFLLSGVLGHLFVLPWLKKQQEKRIIRVRGIKASKLVQDWKRIYFYDSHKNGFFILLSRLIYHGVITIVLFLVFMLTILQHLPQPGDGIAPTPSVLRAIILGLTFGLWMYILIRSLYKFMVEYRDVKRVGNSKYYASILKELERIGAVEDEVSLYRLMAKHEFLVEGVHVPEGTSLEDLTDEEVEKMISEFSTDELKDQIKKLHGSDDLPE